MTPAELRPVFVEVVQKALERYPASQYFHDDGEMARHGFVCGGYHLWMELPTREEEHFEVGPVPINKIKPTEHLLVGAGTLPYDEVKASMITPRKLRNYWDTLERCSWFGAFCGWGGYKKWYIGNGFDFFSDHQTEKGSLIGEPSENAEGMIFAFDIPRGDLLKMQEWALVRSSAKGVPHFLALRDGEGLKACVAAGELPDDGKTDNVEISEHWMLRCIGNKFKVEQKENKMKFEIPEIKKAQEAPKPEPVAKEPVVEKPAGAPKPEEPREKPEVAEVPLKQRLEDAFTKAENIKVLVGEFVKELKPLLKEVGKLEKGAANSSEVKELRSKNKTLEAENTRLKGAVKLLSEKL